jgi:tetratricopeptide (TPR) repeat protein
MTSLHEKLANLRAGVLMRVCWSFLGGPILILLLTAGCTRSTLDRAEQAELAGKDVSALQLYQEALARTSSADTRTKSEILTRIGECLYRIGRSQEAFTSFLKAAELDHCNENAHLRIGELLLAGGSPERAREQAVIVLAMSPMNVEAQALIGASWAASDNPERAREAYQRVLQTDPKRTPVAIALAEIYRQQDQPGKAEEVLKKAAAVAPGNAQPWLGLARIREQQGDGSAAEEAYRKAVSVENTPETNLRLAQFLQRSARVAEAEHVLRKIDAEQPAQPFALADFEFLSGRSAEAAELYRAAAVSRTATAAPQQSPAASSSSQAQAVARLIEAEIATLWGASESQRGPGVTLVSREIDRHRNVLDQGTAIILEAELSLAQNDLVRARQFVSSAKRLAPSSPASHYVAGLVASASGESETAEGEWESALDLDSHYDPARLALAESALERGDGETADEQARAVVRDDPGNLNALLLFSRALLREGKNAPAAIMAQRAAAFAPTSPDPAIILGQVALRLDNIPQAMLNFERAIVHDPYSEEALAGLLQVYRRGPVPHKALQDMEKVAERPPASGTLLEIAGRLYAEHGWDDDAIRTLRRTLQIDPRRISAARVLAGVESRSIDHDQEVSAGTANEVSEPLLEGYRQQSLGHVDPAIASYEKAVREGDPTGAAANNLAWLYAESGRQLDRALNLAEASVRALPDSPAAIDTLGFVHLQRREYSDAVKLLETADRISSERGLDPENKHLLQTIRKHLHEAYLRTGQTEAAQQIAFNLRVTR